MSPRCRENWFEAGTLPATNRANPLCAELVARGVEAFFAVRVDEPTFQLSNVLAVSGCPKDLYTHTKHLVGRDKMPAAIARTFTSDVDSLVLDYTYYELATEEHECISIHARRGEEHQLIDIARIHDEVLTIDCASAVLTRVLDLIESGALLAPMAPVLAVQPAITAEPVRRLLAETRLGYAMRLDSQARFTNIDIPLDESDDAPDGYTVEEVFHITSEEDLPEMGFMWDDSGALAIPMKQLLSPAIRTRIIEYLVAIPSADEMLYFVARPAAHARTRARGEYVLEAIALARRAAHLPTTPLANAYRAHEFHHRNSEPWENILMTVALHRAEMLAMKSSKLLKEEMRTAEKGKDPNDTSA